MAGGSRDGTARYRFPVEMPAAVWDGSGVAVVLWRAAQ